MPLNNDPFQAYDVKTGRLVNPNPDPSHYQVATSGPNAGRYMRKPGALKQFAMDFAPLAVPLGAFAGASFLPGLFGAGGTAGGIAPGVIANTAPNIGAAVAPSMAGAAGGGGAVASGFNLGKIGDFFNSRGGATAIDALAGLYGASKQVGAANHAADLQAEAARQALEWAKQQYQQAMDQYNQWQSGPDMTRLGDLSRQQVDLSRFY